MHKIIINIVLNRAKSNFIFGNIDQVLLTAFRCQNKDKSCKILTAHMKPANKRYLPAIPPQRTQQNIPKSHIENYCENWPTNGNPLATANAGELPHDDLPNRILLTTLVSFD